MRRERGGGTLIHMDEPTVVITLQLRVEEDTLTGRASDGNGLDREFDGWVGLFAALDELVAAPGRG